MINSEFSSRIEVVVHKQQPPPPPLLAAAKKAGALRELQQNDNSSNNTLPPKTLIPQVFLDASGTKRLTPDYTSSTSIFNNNQHFNYYARRKYDFEAEKNVNKSPQEANQISGGPNQMASKTYVSRFSSDEQRLHRFIRLQNFIKQSDGSDDHNRENIRLLLRLSPLELSKHAVELEKRAIQLTIEEGKEMQRMQALNILGKPRNSIPITQQKS